MLRELLIAGVAGITGYIIGVRAGFDAGVRDYTENGARMLQKVAKQKDKFNERRTTECSAEESEGSDSGASAFA